MADGKSILEQLIEEAAAAGKAAGQAEDFVLKLSSTGKDGTHYEVEGVPASKAGGWLREHFGIGDEPAAGEGDGKGDGKGEGEAKPASLRNLFGQGQQGKTG